MGRSSLTQTGEQRTARLNGHGTEALGPSDSSDSGSDIVGGPGLAPDEIGIGLERGQPWGTGRGRRARGAGPDVGDANLDSDSDSRGTGERASAGRDVDAEGQDIGPDEVRGIDELDFSEEDTAFAAEEETPLDTEPERPRKRARKRK